MKIIILSLLTFSIICAFAQTDSTSNTKSKWNKFLNKAKDKTVQLKTNLKETVDNSPTDKKKKNNKVKKEKAYTESEIGINQHIDAKVFKLGKYDYYGTPEGSWKDWDFDLEVKEVKYAENGDVIKINLSGHVYELGFEYNGGINRAYLNTHFYSKKNKKYAVYFKNSFITYKYSGSGDNLTVSDIGATGKPDISLDKLKGILIHHKETIEHARQNVASNKYEWTSNFQSNNWRIVKKGDKYGQINEKDELVFPIKYDKILNIKEGFFWARETDKWMLFDSTAKVVTNEQFDVVSSFWNHKAFVEQGKKIGLIDNKQNINWIFNQMEYDYISDVGNAYVVKKDGKYGLISKSKKVLLDCIYDISYDDYTVKDDILIVQGEDELYGYYKIGHGWLTERIYENARIAHNYMYSGGKKVDIDQYFVNFLDARRTSLSDPLFVYGYVDLDGFIEWQDSYSNKLITPPNKNPKRDKYDWRDNYSTKYRIIKDQPIPVRNKKTRNSGIIDIDGNEIIECKYYSVTDRYPYYFLHIELELAYKYNFISKETSKETVKLVDLHKKKRDEEYDKYMESKYSNSSSSSSSSNSSNSPSSNSSSSETKMVQVNINPNGKAKNYVHIHWSQDGSSNKKSLQTKSTRSINVPEGVKLYYSLDSNSKKTYFYTVPTGKSSTSVTIN